MNSKTESSSALPKKNLLSKLAGMDLRSINFKIWLYFSMFAAVLLLLLWFLQIFFLNNYYEGMKATETKQVAEAITAQYKNPNVFDKISEISIKNDMYIHIEREDKTILFSPSVDEFRKPAYARVYVFVLASGIFKEMLGNLLSRNCLLSISISLR